MAAYLVSHLAAPGNPSQAPQPQPPAAVRLPPKKRLRSSEMMRTDVSAAFMHGEGRGSAVLSAVFQQPTSAAIIVTSHGQTQGYVVNIRFVQEMQSSVRAQQERILALELENRRLRLAALGRADETRSVSL